MYTFTQLTNRSATMSGVNTTQSGQALTNLQQDINQAVRNFKNQARRYWTRKEVQTNLVSGQQYYTFPVDMVRITTVKITSGSLTIPITLFDSEEKWNNLNLIPAMTVGIPTSGFIRGRNELGLYPIPSTNVTNGLTVSYEPRLKDMSIADSIQNVTVTNGSSAVTSSAAFNANMVGMYLSVTNGSDGNWYPIVGYTSPSAITLENVYIGSNQSNAASIIGQAPDIPEDYHLAMAYFATFNYHLQRGDQGKVAEYKGLYEDLLQQFKEVYAGKTTGWTQQDLLSYQYNLFNLPPTGVTS